MESTTYQSFFPLLLIPFLPLAGAAYNGILGATLYRKKGAVYVHLPAILLPWFSFLITLYAFIKLSAGGESLLALYYQAWHWISTGNMQVDFALWFDHLSAVMCLVVTFVGSLIHVYSIGYMKGDPGYWRFFAYLNLFMFSMLVLVLGDNFLLLFIGWEGVGLCSYLLISFWYKDRKNAAAGMKAFVVNRIGDFGFVVGVFLIYWGMTDVVQSLNLAPEGSLIFRQLESWVQNDTIREALLQAQVFNLPLLTLACVALFVGAMGKSAQIPLYVWLPDAMAGPTPVSALIHAATMVTAGVYMVARLNFLYVLSPFAMTWVATFGVVTALFAATIGFLQHDIKKVLAYSTISQLGYMFVGVGIGAYSAGIFHLMTHAFFKGCLFLAAGSVIIGCHHNQDMRLMGGLKKYMPLTHWSYLMACLAISGVPFFSGFFSKDEILFRAYISNSILLPGGGKTIWFIGAVAAAGTAYYMFRSYYLTFSGTYRGDASHKPHESPGNMVVVLIILGTLSIIGGYVGLPAVFHLPNLFENWLEPVFAFSSEMLPHGEHTMTLEWTLMIISVLLAFSGIAIARWLYRDGRNPLPARLLASKNPVIRFSYQLVYNKYYVDEFYQGTVVRFVLGLRLFLDWIDRNIIDWSVNFVAAMARYVSHLAGITDLKGVDGVVNGTADTVKVSGRTLTLLQTGRLRNYLGFALGGSIALIIMSYLLY